MSRKQRLSWMISAALVPMVTLCPGRNWPWVLAGCAAAALFYGLVYGLLRRFTGEENLTALLPRALGRLGGKAVLILSGLWALLAAAMAARVGAGAFPDGEAEQFAAPVLLVLAALAGYKGTVCGARCGAILPPLLVAVYVLILACAVPGVQTQWLRPSGSWQEGAPILAAMLVPTAALFLPRQQDGEDCFPLMPLLALLLLPTAAAAVTAGNLSPQLCARESFPFYTLTKSVSLVSVMERFEPLLSAALLLNCFCLLSLLIASASHQLAMALGVQEGKWLQPALCAAVYGLSFPLRQIGMDSLQLGATIFWGLIPVLTLLIAAIRKNEKKSRNQENSA